MTNKERLTFKQRFSSYVKRGFNTGTIIFLVVNIIVFLTFFLILFFRYRAQAEQNKIALTTLKICDALTVANIMVFSLNILALIVRRGFGRGIIRFFRQTFNGMKYYKDDDTFRKSQQRKHNNSFNDDYYDALRNQKNQQPKEISSKDPISWKSSSFIFIFLILLTIILQIILIPFMVR
ncbi:hypothetical protein ACWXVL_02790 [Mycoplasma sp. 128]|uniref:hypothetical protein n=1 Tax=Mycoplasma sp. 3341 TaxID=3447506 RepID=UPI003F659DB5